MSTVLAVSLCIGSATVGGVFFAFSSFVLRALGQLPTGQGIAAMQRINVVVLNPVFLGAFLGTALLALGSAARALVKWSDPRAAWLFAAGLLYLCGAFLVTVACNVPRNERLAKLDLDSPAAAEPWRLFRRGWAAWNHVRTLASLASAICAAGAIVAGD